MACDCLLAMAPCLLDLLADKILRNQFRTDIIIRDLEEAKRENFSERELQINTNLLFTNEVSLRENRSEADLLLHTDAVEAYILGRNVRNTMVEA
mmetsp:Transcript_17512/g.39573  ORF Transcript_17512/g.39573 Transcript_17512/m.39573 type:complete len:95 (+) Transcript_17512:155-439(+)